MLGGRALQGVLPEALQGAFDVVWRRHKAMDPASYNQDVTYKRQLNQVRGPRNW